MKKLCYNPGRCDSEHYHTAQGAAFPRFLLKIYKIKLLNFLMNNKLQIWIVYFFYLAPVGMIFHMRFVIR